MADNFKFIGNVYGTLEVIDIGGVDNGGKRLFLVKCLNHPNEAPHYVRKTFLTTGKTKHCSLCRIEGCTKHGMWNTKTYHTFTNMVKRVTNVNNIAYKNYGGRGIDIDPKYNPLFEQQGVETAFNNFLNDIGEIPEKLTLDRIDNNKGYWKDNLRFVNAETQNQNSRNTKINAEQVKQLRIEYKSGKVTFQQLAKRYNISVSGIKKIIYKTTWKNI